MTDAQTGQETWTILRVLDWTRHWFEKKGIEEARVDAEVLLAHALGMERVMLYAHHDRPLSEIELSNIRSLVSRRGQREPVAYITSEREFWSRSFKVTNAVLIPRPDTEVLVEVALERLKSIPNPLVIDVGTGSGCIAIAIASERRDARIFAIDVSTDALKVAAENVDRHELSDRIELVESHLLSKLDKCLVPDLVVANLPYVSRKQWATLSTEVADHEPRLALDGGGDGLELIRELIRQAQARLASGSGLALEMAPDQTSTAKGFFEGQGFGNISIREDYAGLERVVSGERL